MQLWEMNRKMMSPSGGSKVSVDHKSIQKHQLVIYGQPLVLGLQVEWMSRGKNSESSPCLWINLPWPEFLHNKIKHF